MADESTRQILRTALELFDDPHLQKLRVAAYDRWNWDSSSDADKDWFELAEEILTDRGVDVNPSTLTLSGPNGAMPRLTLEATGDLVLGASGSIKATDSSVQGSIVHELFEVKNSNQLELGWELKIAIVSFLNQEMINGSISGNNGQTLSQALEGEVNKYAPAAVRNRL